MRTMESSDAAEKSNQGKDRKHLGNTEDADSLEPFLWSFRDQMMKK